MRPLVQVVVYGQPGLRDDEMSHISEVLKDYDVIFSREDVKLYVQDPEVLRRVGEQLELVLVQLAEIRRLLGYGIRVVG
ncbi:MAG: hypothetical protein AB1330_01090 [Bacillota bacterium]